MALFSRKTRQAPRDQSYAMLLEVENFPPDWDLEHRIADAKKALAEGVERQTVVAIYGQDVARKAETGA